MNSYMFYAPAPSSFLFFLNKYSFFNEIPNRSACYRVEMSKGGCIRLHKLTFQDKTLLQLQIYYLISSKKWNVYPAI